MRMLRCSLGIAAALLLVAAASPAHAAEVYFNGVRVTGLKNQSFKNCMVRFDAKGNVYVTAKGYTVKTLERGDAKQPKGTAKASPKSKRYYLVSAGKRVKAAQYDVDVFLNGKWFRKIRSSEPQVVVDITDRLKRGRNLVNFTATKNYGGKGRASTSAADYLRVLIGVGTSGGGTVSISKTLAEFRATADKVANFGNAVTIDVE